MNEDINKLTEALITEDTLNESDLKYRLLFENMAEEVHFWKLVRYDSGMIKTWHLVDANPPALRTWGFKSVDEIRGKTADEIFGPGAAEHYMNIVKKIMAEGKAYSYEDYFPHLDKYFRLTSVPLGEYFFTTGADITSIKKTQEDLKHSRESYEQAQAVGSMGNWRLNIQRNELIWSDENYRIFGLPKGTSLTYETFLSTIHPDDHAYVDSKWKAAMTGEEYDIEHRIIAGGSIKWVREKAFLEFDEAGNLVAGFGITQDITARKTLEEKLKKYNETLEENIKIRTEELAAERQRLFDVLETLPVYVVLLDKDYRVPFANKFFRERFGDSNGRRCYEYLFNKTEECDNCETYKVMRTGGMHNWEWEGPDGRNYEIYDFPFKDTDGSEMIMEMGIDVTDRKIAEESLKSERKRFYDVLETLPVMVSLLTTDFRIAFSNKAFRNKFGESHGRKCYEYCFGLTEPCASCEVHKVLETGEPNRWELSSPDGSIIDVYDFPFKDVDGTPMVLKMDIDITEKQKMETELLKTEKLQSLGILAGGIAHDFNNLLAAILSNIQLAQMQYKKHKNIERYLEDSANSAYRACDLTRQLLTFSKGGAPVKKAATLTEMIRDTATFALRGSLVKVDFNIVKDLWQVEVDSGQISQVIHNLAINAKQSMPNGGIVRINAENVVITSAHSFNPGRYIKISVTDQGVGIPKEYISRIYDPFFTTKSEGSGLGLTTSYSIIKQHDGYLEVESQPENGTTFYVYLPVLTTKLMESGTDIAESLNTEHLKILLMDDEKAILLAVSEMLEMYGHQVDMVTNGKAAIEKYQENLNNNDAFDLVIMDLTIPGGMGGKETIARLKDIHPSVKAIIFSGYTNDPVMSDHEKFGFCGVLGKPFKIDELLKILNLIRAK